MNRQQTRRWTQNWITPARPRKPLEAVALLAALFRPNSRRARYSLLRSKTKRSTNAMLPT